MKKNDDGDGDNNDTNGVGQTDRDMAAKKDIHGLDGRPDKRKQNGINRRADDRRTIKTNRDTGLDESGRRC